MSISNKHIVLGITGGIAAYKSADLARRLRERGAQVRVVMTANATRFITPLTLQAVSANPVHTSLLDPEAEAGMGHIELARWADGVLVAPATANFISRLAHGAADDLLTTLCLATPAPVALAPAMNQQMWLHPATRNNVRALELGSVYIFGPDEGEQACGDSGPGRMLEPAALADAVSALFHSNSLDNLKIVVTAGPTWEAIDPVRGLTNLSSGKMGYAVADAAAASGARVILVSGPTSLPEPENVHRISVTSAQEMHDVVMAETADANIFIAVAAVADYRPLTAAAEKIKKHSDTLTIELVRNPDILTLAAQQKNLYTVGFAAETSDVEKNAREKLENKAVDLIAANKVGGGDGFGTDDNALVLIDGSMNKTLPRMRKTQLARCLVDEIAERYHAKNTG
jgi:phosphopantothenoylcysteine decarboxylase/phosphopantothenate--cysteine ligase